MIRIEIDKSRVKKIGKSLFLFLDEKEIDAQLERLDTLPEVYEYPKNGYYEIPIRLFDKVLTVLEDWEIHIYGDIPKDIVKRIDTQNRISETEVAGYKFKTEPFKHQIESFEYAQTKDCFLLADEQGLGKTKQALDIAVSRKGSFKHCLIVSCVGGLKWNWRNEVDVHTHEDSHILGHRKNNKGGDVIDGLKKRTDDLMKTHEEYFLITDIRTMGDKNFRYLINEMCLSGEIGMVIVDEIHKCKKPTTMFGEALNFLNSYYRLALTGTPLLNTPVDLYPTLAWLGVENHNYTDFKNHYCIMEGDGFIINGYKNIDELTGILNSVMLRRLKEDVLDLPLKTFVTEYVDMGTKQQSIYAEIKTKLIQDIDRIKLSNHPLADIIRLRQATGNPEILTTEKVTSSKYERASEIIEEAIESGTKVIVYSNWTKVIDPYFKELSKYNPAIVTGKLKDTEKDHEIRRFMSDPTCKIIVGTVSSLGTGYTLTEATTVIFLDEPWTQGSKDQAIDRVHRIGAKGNITIYTLICKNTVDERVNEIVSRKGKLSNIVVDNSGSVEVGDVTELLNYLLF